MTASLLKRSIPMLLCGLIQKLAKLHFGTREERIRPTRSSIIGALTQIQEMLCNPLLPNFVTNGRRRRKLGKLSN